jgi:hypothetical protein
MSPYTTPIAVSVSGSSLRRLAARVDRMASKTPAGLADGLEVGSPLPEECSGCAPHQWVPRDADLGALGVHDSLRLHTARGCKKTIKMGASEECGTRRHHTIAVVLLTPSSPFVAPHRLETKSVRKTKRVDERRQRSWLLATARVIQEIASEWRAPIFQDAHQSTTPQVSSRVLLQREPQADTVNYGTREDLDVVYDQRPFHRDG